MGCSGAACGFAALNIIAFDGLSTFDLRAELAAPSNEIGLEALAGWLHRKTRCCTW